MSTPDPASPAQPLPPVAGVYPPELAARENELIRARRVRSGGRAEGPVVGLALSGGGIRSATFCLGVLQAFAQRSLLRRVDLLSTVSGGGYIGSFLGAWIHRTDIDQVESQLAQLRSPPVDFLRENGRYLTPNGGDGWAALTSHLRSWLAVLFVLGTLAFAGLLGVVAVQELAWEHLGSWYPVWAEWPVPFFGGALQLYLSPWWAAAGLVLALGGVPLAVAYWLIGPRPGQPPLILLAAVIGTVVVTVQGAWPAWPEEQMAQVWAASLALTVAASLWGFIRAAWKRDIPGVRREFTEWLGVVLFVAVGLGGLGVVDTLGRTALHFFKNPVWGTALAAGWTLVQWFWPKVLAGLQDDERPSVPLTFSAAVAAALLAGLLLAGLSTAAHAIALAERAEFTLVHQPPEPGAAGRIGIWALLTLAIAALTGFSKAFLNLSSHHQLYSARLTRAYLGASNPRRQSAPEGPNVTLPVPGDQLPIREYAPHAQGGPLHVINVTINETLSGRSQVEQRDRKGVPFAIGAAGLSVGRLDHGLFEAGSGEIGWLPEATPAWLKRLLARLQPPPPELLRPLGKPPAARFHALCAQPSAPEIHAVELLPLGSWVGISGAAFTTGLGQRTSVGLSFLAGIFNVRLGYWWDSGVNVWRRKTATRASWPGQMIHLLQALIPVQSHLLSELLGRFRGTARRLWYLSDGGHFENTALYELIRRRVPLMVVCDCGADPAYVFDDLGGLTLKARMDFGAHLEFLGRDEIDAVVAPEVAHVFGPLADFTPTKECPLPACCAALARIRYDNGPGQPEETSTLILLKPSVCGEEPADLINYDAHQGEFPQEPTADQFFDEAQWESYRALGEFIGRKVFARAEPGADPAAWRPADLRPLP